MLCPFDGGDVPSVASAEWPEAAIDSLRDPIRGGQHRDGTSAAPTLSTTPLSSSESRLGSNVLIEGKAYRRQSK